MRIESKTESGWLAVKKEKEMEYTFEAIWRLLNPQGEFVRRVNACGKLWNGLAEHRRKHIYETIKNLKAQGKYVNPNPLFAIKDNDTAEPFDWNGHALDAGRHYVTARWNGKWGTYTIEDVRDFGMETK